MCIVKKIVVTWGGWGGMQIKGGHMREGGRGSDVYSDKR